MRESSLFARIQRNRKVSVAMVVLAVIVFAFIGYFFYQRAERSVAGILVENGGDKITFTSGFFTVDNSGNVYAKSGSEIANTPDSIYPFVSYLSEPYLYGGSQLNIYQKEVVVGSGANVYMEGYQIFSNLTVQTGGTITQPQADRAGFINRYQYSDQEWALEFKGFVKIPDGQSRKLTCATNYHNGDGGNPIGNGCLVQYHPTETDLDDIESVDWTDLDKVWQTALATFDTTRYSALGSITNASGADKYYPVRIIFKDDYFDDRDENMEVYLRNAAGTIIDQEGNDISAESPNSIELAQGTLYGASSDGTVNTAASAEMRLNYYLLDEYLATVADPDLGWVDDTLSNAYRTYSNNNVEIDSFFDSGYGEDQDGYFDLVFDDNTSWDGTYASSPFAKGTSNVIDSEVYKNYAYSAKTTNPNISSGPATRYIDLGINITIAEGDVNFEGGIIDLSGKGYPGYSYELRSASDGAGFVANGGAGKVINGVTYGDGRSTNDLPQSGAHGGYGGSGVNSSVETGRNTDIYDYEVSPIYGGAGGGSSSVAAGKPTHGGNGGGLVSINANRINLKSTNVAIKVNGVGGSRIQSGLDKYSGGAGGSISISCLELNNTVNLPSSSYFFEAKGGYNNSGSAYSGGGGGFFKLVSKSFTSNQGSDSAAEKISAYATVIAGVGSSANYYGTNGEVYVAVNPYAVHTLTPSSPQKSFTVSGKTSSSVQRGQTGTLTVSVDGILDQSITDYEPLDLVIVSDLSSSMEGGKLDLLKESVISVIDKVISSNESGGSDTALGLVAFNSNIGTTSSDLSKNSGDLAQYRDDVNNYLAQNRTNAGDGLLKAYDLMQSGGRSGVKKYIILVTDGMENEEPCITNEFDFDDCRNPRPHDPTPNSPLKRIIDAKYGLFTVGIGTGNYSEFLGMIAEKTRPADFDGEMSYEILDDASQLGETLSLILGDIVPQGAGMAFQFTETLPPNIRPEDVTVSTNISGVSHSVPYTVSFDPASKRVTYNFSVSSGMYEYDDLPDVRYNELKFNFVFDIRFKNIASGNYDLDQNVDPESGYEDGDEIKPPWSSYITYQPVGSYLGQSQIPTPPLFITVVPQITIKKELKPFLRMNGSTELLERFNPYSVTNNDTLLVELTASPIISGVETSIKDELMQNNQYICMPETDASLKLSGSADATVKSDGSFLKYNTPFLEDNSVIFENFVLKDGETRATLRYICKLQNR